MFTIKLSSRLPAAFALLALLALNAFSAPIHAQPPDFAGSLAYIGADGNVYVLDAHQTDPIALTDDASRQRLYLWPTWANDGRLAYFAHDSSGGGLTLRVMIAPPESAAAVTAYEAENELFNYAYWSPAPCPGDDACRDLAVLISDREGLSVVRVREQAGAFTSERLARGAPFYYSYAPDGSQMLWQRYGDRLNLYDTTSGEISARLPDTVGFFQAPMWSPVDDRLLFSVVNDVGEHDLVIADGDERRVLAADQRGRLWFAWSPDAEHVAYMLNYGALTVVNSASGEEITRSSTDQVIAFFWSPDSSKIAYLSVSQREDGTQVAAPEASVGVLASPSPQREQFVMTWNVIDLATDTQWTYARGFLPTQEMLYMIEYFDQFAQSHRVWSADSRHLVYGEISAAGEPVLTLLNASDPYALPQPLLPGRIGVWRFD